MIHMTASKENILFYRDWWVIVKRMPREQQLEMLRALLDYSFDDCEPQEGTMADLMTYLMRRQIDRDRDRYNDRCEVNRSNGRRGGRPRRQQTGEPEPESESESEPAPEAEAEAAPEPAPAPVQPDMEAFEAFYNAEAEAAGAAIPQLRALTPARQALLQARIKEHGKDAVATVVRKAMRSKFLNGGGVNGFVAGFDWLFAPDRFVRVLEGEFDNRRPRLTPPSTARIASDEAARHEREMQTHHARYAERIPGAWTDQAAISYSEYCIRGWDELSDDELAQKLRAECNRPAEQVAR